MEQKKITKPKTATKQITTQKSQNGGLTKQELIDRTQERYNYTAKLLARGWPKLKIREELKQKYGVGNTTVNKYITNAYKIFSEKQDEFIANLRNIQLNRLETILDASIEKKDYRTANDIIKTINSMFGLNAPETVVAIKDEIKFEFGDPLNNG